MLASAVRRWLFESAAIVVAYYAVASLVTYSHLGVVGNTHLLWLPAGIALAAVLVRGLQTIPALMTATLLFHYQSFFAGNSPPLQAYAAAVITASGSTLQAWATAWLLRKQAHILRINTIGDAMRFIGYAAIGCTIAASIGSLTLMHQDRIDTASLPLTWLTWWVGDLSGMLVVAPVVLVVRTWRRGRREWSQLSLPIIGIGFSFTLVTAFIVKHLDHSARMTEFYSSGVAMGQSLQRNIDLSLRDLAAVQAVYYNITLSRTEFQHFTQGIQEANPLIKGIAWIPRVRHEERAAFEAKARQDGNKHFVIRDVPDGKAVQPAAARPEYFPLLLLSPEVSNLQSAGIDLLTHPTRRDTLAMARLSGEPQATAPLQLLSDDASEGPSIVIYWPVYRNEFRQAPEMRDDRDLRGFVSMSFRIRKLAMESILPFENRKAETWLIDVTEPGNERLLYHHIDGEADMEDGAIPKLESLRQGIHHETAYTVAGRQWLMISRPSDLTAELRANGQFIGILVAGGGFTFLLAIYMIGRQRSEDAMRIRDDRLMSQNAVLTQLARFTSPLTDTEEQIRQLAATSAVTLKVERVSVWLLKNDDRKLECAALFTRSTGQFSSGFSLDAKDYPRYFETLYAGRGFAANDAQTDARTSEFTDKYLKPLGITSMLDVPIRIGGRLAGVVCHEHIGPARTWAPDEQSFAASIGDHASLVLESALRAQAEAALQESHQALEQKVEQRTEELRKANERLRQLDQLKSMFIASMSHELRTPLNSIIGFTGVVLQGISGTLTDRQRDQLERVYGSAKHLLALITDVIDISKIEAGYVDTYVEAFRLNDVIDEAISSVQNQCHEKGLTLTVEMPGTIAVHSDRKRLLQCILNVISNAVKYSERGGISVQVTERTDRIVIDVTDTGIGIEEEGLAKLFQPFERIDTHLRIKTPGTGLGLYLTRKIMTDILHGGISVTSKPGRGSTFTLWIPPAISGGKPS